MPQNIYNFTNAKLIKSCVLGNLIFNVLQSLSVEPFLFIYGFDLILHNITISQKISIYCTKIFFQMDKNIITMIMSDHLSIYVYMLNNNNFALIDKFTPMMNIYDFSGICLIDEKTYFFVICHENSIGLYYSDSQIEKALIDISENIFDSVIINHKLYFSTIINHELTIYSFDKINGNIAEEFILHKLSDNFHILKLFDVENKLCVIVGNNVIIQIYYDSLKYEYLKQSVINIYPYSEYFLLEDEDMYDIISIRGLLLNSILKKNKKYIYQDTNIYEIEYIEHNLSDENNFNSDRLIGEIKSDLMKFLDTFLIQTFEKCIVVEFVESHELLLSFIQSMISDNYDKIMENYLLEKSVIQTLNSLLKDKKMHKHLIIKISENNKHFIDWKDYDGNIFIFENDFMIKHNDINYSSESYCNNFEISLKVKKIDNLTKHINENTLINKHLEMNFYGINENNHEIKYYDQNNNIIKVSKNLEFMYINKTKKSIMININIISTMDEKSFLIGQCEYMYICMDTNFEKTIKHGRIDKHDRTDELSNIDEIIINILE